MIENAQVERDETEKPSQLPEYWLEELDVACEFLDEKYSDAERLREKLDRLSFRTINLMAERLGMNGDHSTTEKRVALAAAYDLIRDAVYVLKFGERKARVAIEELAAECLSVEDMESCEVTPGKYDKDALLLLINRESPESLKSIYLLEKIHKKGFAQMALNGAPSRTKEQWVDFLSSENVQGILNRYDSDRRDGRVSLCKDIVDRNGRRMVFIRMEEKLEIFSRDGKNIPGYVPDWVILDFAPEGKNVRLSSITPVASVEIANRIASEFYGKECKYTNDVELTHSSVISNFLQRICFEEIAKLPIVEISARNTSLDSGVSVRISDPCSLSIGPAISRYTESIGDLIDEISDIDWIKVHYRTRVTLKFEVCEDDPEYFIVRYSDYTLQEKERREFEGMMVNEYGLRLLSTEKKFAA